MSFDLDATRFFRAPQSNFTKGIISFNTDTEKERSSERSFFLISLMLLNHLH